MNTTKKLIFDHVFKTEGGVVNHKDDLGGMTGTGGITEYLVKKYHSDWERFGVVWTDGTLPIEFVYHVYDSEFWNKDILDSVNVYSPGLASVMMGWGINSGMSRPVRALQRYLNVSNRKGTDYGDIVADGLMGRKTLLTLEHHLKRNPSYGEYNAISFLLAQQRSFYLDITEARADDANESFFNGWANRARESSRFLETLGVANVGI